MAEGIKEADSDNVALGTAYEFAKQAYQNTFPYNDEDLVSKLKEIAQWFKGRRYAMLLCHEYRDYTVFDFTKPNYQKAAMTNLKKCLTNRGKVLDIRKNKSDMYEIWMKIDGEIYMYYLFDARDFVIQVPND